LWRGFAAPQKNPESYNPRFFSTPKQRLHIVPPLLFVKFILIPMGLSGYNGGAEKVKIYEVSIVES
jgi:hypothetical protein